jgi:hypothetical protein
METKREVAMEHYNHVAPPLVGGTDAEWIDHTLVKDNLYQHSWIRSDRAVALLQRNTIDFTSE